MVKSTFVLGLATISGFATAALPNAPLNAAPEAVCSTKPFKQWLPLSRLPGAQNFCNNKFPLATPTCSTTITQTRVLDGVTTQIDTSTVNEATVVTVTIAPATITAATTIAAPDVTLTTTQTTTVTQIFCLSSGTTTTSNAAATATSTTLATSTTSAAPQVKRYAGPYADPDDGNLVARQALSPSARASLQARLQSVRSLFTGGATKKARASTICACIRTNPVCSTTTATETATIRSTSYSTTTITLNPTVTQNVTITGTLTVFQTITTGTPLTFNTFSNTTVTQFSTGCNLDTSSSSGGATTTATTTSSA